MGNCINNKHISEETRNNAKLFIPQIAEGVVVKVYDGDTITIVCTKIPNIIGFQFGYWALIAPK